ncbi:MULTISPECIES: amino-acid N-acetyltransferase [unclassified Acinetobacter]|uniref:amino-acid N-acetyltransferase n=1 Tax=unclassified Acinetobacter TaxID=196816 RepID=UPI0035BAF957
MSNSVYQHITPDYVRWFRHSAPYIHAHQDKTFVILLTGEAIQSDFFEDIIHDIALLHSLNIRLILVHGARPQIDQALTQANIQSEYHQHRRITPQHSLPHILGAIGQVRLKLEAMLSMGLANSPMYQARINVASGNVVTAKPYGVHDGVDFQWSGEVRSISRHHIQNHLANGSIVLISPLGYSNTGEIFNVTAEEVAYRVALALQADKLIFFSEKQGIEDAKQQLQRELHPNQIDDYLDYYAQDGAFLSVLKFAKLACQNGIHRVHFLPFQHDGALLQELFTRDGVGSMVSNRHYEDVRMATIGDIQGLMQLLQPLEQQGILVYRPRERLEQEIEQFAVIERDGMIISCAALHPIVTQSDEINSAEIACVAVHPDYRNSNRGEQILQFLQDKARSQNIQQVFILTTRTAHWFIEQGFVQCAVSDLPQARQHIYNHQRNSQVYRKLL